MARRVKRNHSAEFKAIIRRDHDLSIKRQAELLGIGRENAYYLPRPVSEADLMRARWSVSPDLPPRIAP